MDNLVESVIITEAHPEDALGVQEVFYHSWMDVYPNEKEGITREDIEYRFKDSFTDEVVAKRAEKLKSFMVSDKDKFWVAKIEGRVVGLCRAEKRESENELRAIYVLPEYQGKKIGLLLWRTAEKFFEPHYDTILHVVTYNEKAITFYLKLGFIDTGKRFVDEAFRLQSGSIFPQMEMVKKASN
jgi:ribosomal protein S18 acetylase RimI-like enzyme